MIINETKCDVELNLKASKNMAGRKIFLILGIVAALCLASGAVTLALELSFASESETDLFFPIVCFGCGVVLLLLMVVWNPLLRKVMRKTMQGKESVNLYSFFEESYTIVSTVNDGMTSSAEGKYGALTEVREFQDMWLLYQNKATVFAVAKSGMKEGSVEELTALLMRQTGNNYKICFKRK